MNNMVPKFEAPTLQMVLKARFQLPNGVCKQKQNRC